MAETAARELVSTVGMSREDWLRARKTGIGSSDGPAVLGLDKYRSPLAVYLDKRDLLPEFEGNRFTYWGTRLEPLVADWFVEDAGKTVEPKLAILQHPDRPYVIADVDRLVVDEGVPLEIKTTDSRHRDEWEDGEIPLRVVVQLQHQLAVTGAAYGYWAVLVGGNDPRWGRLERDDALIAQMMDRYEAFWRGHVEAGVEPVPSAASDVDTLGRLYPDGEEGKTVLLPSAARATLDALAMAKAATKAAKEAEETAKARVQALLGDAEAGYLPGVADPVVTWKRTERAGYTVAPVTFRQLTLKERALNGRQQRKGA